MHKVFASVIGLLLISTPVFAAEAVPSAQGPLDEQAIDKLIEPVIDALKSGKSKQAINDYFATNPVMGARQAEINNLALQAEGVNAVFGRLTNCQLPIG